MGASYTTSAVHSVTLAHEPGSLAAFTRSVAEDGMNIRSLYVLKMGDESAEIGYTID